MYLQRFYIWLQKPLIARKIPSYVLGATLLNLFATLSMAVFLMQYNAPLPQLISKDDALWYMPLLLLIDVFIEELLFRAPLSIKAFQSTPTRLLISTLTISALFGFVHGTVFNIAIQGISGIIFSILFLKGGGLQGKFWRGIALSGAVHALGNGILWVVYMSSL